LTQRLRCRSWHGFVRSSVLNFFTTLMRERHKYSF
jgi:hypothetical protein